MRTLVGACAVAFVVASCGSGGGREIAATTTFNVVSFSPEERKVAPAVAGASLGDGAAVEASLTRGAVAVVNFWGSWCGPCRREQPTLERLHREYEPRGVRFVGVNTRRDQKAAARAYLEEFDVTYPSIYDPASAIAYRFGVRFMPVTYAIDRQGRIAAIFVGALRDEADLRLVLDAELGAP